MKKYYYNRSEVRTLVKEAIQSAKFRSMREPIELNEDWEDDHFRHNTHSHTEAANTLQAIRSHPSFHNAPDSLKRLVNGLHSGHKNAALANKQAVIRNSRQMAGQDPDAIKSKAHAATNNVAAVVYRKSSPGFIKAELPKRKP